MFLLLFLLFFIIFFFLEQYYFPFLYILVFLCYNYIDKFWHIYSVLKKGQIIMIFSSKDALLLQRSYDISFNNGVITVVESSADGGRGFYTSTPQSNEMRLDSNVFKRAMDYLCRVDTDSFMELLSELHLNPNLATYYYLTETVHWSVASVVADHHDHY